MRDFVQTDTIFMTVAGSHMYGTATPASDLDKRGICIPPRNVAMGFARRFEQQEFPNEDTVVFSLTKFMELASECNPNIVELLYAPEDCVQVRHPIVDVLYSRRDEFLSAKAFNTFTGYAHSQLKRIETHRRWLFEPPTKKPLREDFGLKESSGGVRDLTKGVDPSEFEDSVSAEVFQAISREKAYKAALTQWNQYTNWLSSRNPTRAKLESEFGYDTKHAAHLVRLLRMGAEILTRGEVLVRRPDAPELLSIRNGAWSYNKLMDYASEIDASLKAIYENKQYVVPAKPDREALSDFCVELHERYWSWS